MRWDGQKLVIHLIQSHQNWMYEWDWSTCFGCFVGKWALLEILVEQIQIQNMSSLARFGMFPTWMSTCVVVIIVVLDYTSFTYHCLEYFSKGIAESLISRKSANAERWMSMQVRYPDHSGGLIIDDKMYTLKQMHWHAPSEHRINGFRYA